jgi:hypothetical protein
VLRLFDGAIGDLLAGGAARTDAWVAIRRLT